MVRELEMEAVVHVGRSVVAYRPILRRLLALVAALQPTLVLADRVLRGTHSLLGGPAGPGVVW